MVYAAKGVLRKNFLLGTILSPKDHPDGCMNAGPMILTWCEFVTTALDLRSRKCFFNIILGMILSCGRRTVSYQKRCENTRLKKHFSVCLSARDLREKSNGCSTTLHGWSTDQPGEISVAIGGDIVDRCVC